MREGVRTGRSLASLTGTIPPATATIGMIGELVFDSSNAIRISVRPAW